MKKQNTKLVSSVRKANTALVAASMLGLVACGGSNEVETIVVPSSALTPPPVVDDPPPAPAVVGGLFALSNGFDPAAQVGAAADAPVEPTFVNEVVAYRRLDDGTLEEAGTFGTGGDGENIRASGANPLASQDPLILSEDNSLLFAVNAGSESISSFVVNDDMTLTPASVSVSTQGTSQAENPVSLTIRGDILYVANTGIFVDGNLVVPADRNRINSSLIGFTVGADGTLTELAGSEITDNNIAANVGSIDFSVDGLTLYVTERRTNNIVSISMTADGLPERDADGALVATTITSNTDQPFGTDIAVTSEGTEVLLVSEGNNGAVGLSAASSYVVGDDGALTVASASTGELGDPLLTQFTFGCWIESVLAPNNTVYAYTANTPNGTLSGYSVANDGTMSRIFPVPGNVVAADATAEGSAAAGDVGGAGVLDTEIAFPYLYQVVSVGDGADDANNARIAVFEISAGGVLTPRFELNQENAAFRQGMFVGVAGF